MSRLSDYKQDPYATVRRYTDSNATPTGDRYLDISKDLHTILEQWVYSGLGRGSVVKVPMGNRKLSVLGSSGGVSTVVAGKGAVVTGNLPPPIDRRDITPDEEVVRVTTAKKFGDYKTWAEMKAETGYLPSDYQLYNTPQDYIDGRQKTAVKTSSASILPPDFSTAPGTIIDTWGAGTTTTKSTGSKSMDLGALLTDLGTAYIQTKYAQPAVQAQPALSLPGWGDVVEFFDESTGNVVQMPAGQKKRCRRRRRRLATTSDIKDLAALKAVLGNGEAFKTWIATHSR